MIDDLLHVAQQEFLRGREFYRAGAMPRALVAYHAGLEQLLRFALIRDGADYDRATDPNQINWQTLITYLDVRYALPREQCVFLSQMTHLRDQVLAGGNPELSPMVMQGYDKLVTQIFRRLYPRDQAARNEAAMRGTFAPRRPVADINARPPERANETNIIAPVAPPPEGPHPPVSAAGVSLPPTGLHPASIDRLGPAHPHGAATNPPPPAHASPGYQAHPPASAQAPANGGMPANGDSPPWAPQSPPTAPGHAAPVPSPDEQQRRAIEAGRRLREMRIQGLDYCPQCRSQIPITSPICPQCGFDVESYRARQAPAPPRAESKEPVDDVGFVGVVTVQRQFRQRVELKLDSFRSVAKNDITRQKRNRNNTRKEILYERPRVIVVGTAMLPQFIDRLVVRHLLREVKQTLGTARIGYPFQIVEPRLFVEIVLQHSVLVRDKCGPTRDYSRLRYINIATKD